MSFFLSGIHPDMETCIYKLCRREKTNYIELFVEEYVSFHLSPQQCCVCMCVMVSFPT